MPDVLETLLKYVGDASGLVRASQEAIRSIQAVEQAHAAASARMAGGAGDVDPATGLPRGQLSMYRDSGAEDAARARVAQTEAQLAAQRDLLAQIEATGQVIQTDTPASAGAVNNLTEAFGKNRAQAEAMKMAIAKVSPELAGLLDLLYRGPTLLEFFGTSAGKAMLGITGLVAAAAGAFMYVRSEMRDAEKQAESFAQTQQRIKDAATATRTEVGDAFAATGQTEAAVNKGAALVRSLTEQGFDESAARAVAPFAVDEQGNQIVDDAELGRLVAASQAGLIDPLTGKTARHRAASLNRARRQLGQPDIAEQVSNAEKIYRERAARQAEALASGDMTALRKFLEESEGLSPEDAAERAATLSRQLKNGPDRITRESMPTPIPMGPMGSGYVLPPARAADGPEYERLDPLVPIFRNRAESSRNRANTVQPAGQTVNFFNHGSVFMGGPSRLFDRQPRVVTR